MVAALANATNSEMHVVHVGQVVHMIFAFTEEEPGQVGRIEAAGGNVAQVHLRSGGATGEVVTVAEDMGVGLIVMGSRGRGGIRRSLMGSVSDSEVRHAHSPLTIVRV